jgi:F0F1-type ATP synthase membrane subunit b/b'
MPQADTTYYLSQSLWLLICFCALWGVMHFWVIPLFLRTVSGRQSALRDLIGQHQKCVQQVLDLEIQAQEALDRARQDGQRIVSQAQVLAYKAIEDALRESQGLYESRLTQMRQQIEVDQEKACLQIQDRAPELIELCVRSWNVPVAGPSAVGLNSAEK